MSEPYFILSKKVLEEQVRKLEDLGLKISYSYKTNRVVGKVLQELSDVHFSIHAKEEIEEIKDKSKINFFLQAENKKELEEILEKGIRSFVIDNEVDLKNLLEIIEDKKIKINLSLRMKFLEHRIGTGKYFVYGMNSSKVKDILLSFDKTFINKLGIHLHRKSQNVSEWEIISEVEDSLPEEVLKKVDFINLGGGLPSIYRSSNVKAFDYVFEKLKETKTWCEEKGIGCFIEPGRFLAAPCVKLVTKVIQKYDNTLVLNTTIYNCALDNVLTNTKMLIEGEGESGNNYLIKGNSPTRDDIFRYRVRLKNVELGEEIVFLNAGAYNYTTDFFGYKRLKTEIVD